MRALAVCAVLAYHFDFSELSVSSGFYGVDIFFVVSGYLITRLLVQSAKAQNFQYRTFYTRRFRRLMPAFLAMVATTLIAGYLLLLPGDYVDLGNSARFAVFGLSNLYFYLETGYFDQTSGLMPLLHTWSLAIEEQFYLLWPLIVAFSLRLGGRRALILVMLTAAFLSLSYCLALVTWEQKAAFYSPATRAWELIAGAMLVFAAPLPLGSRGQNGTGILGLALLLLGVMLPVDAQTTPGWNTLLPVCGAMLVIWPKTCDGPAERILTLPVVRYIGLISYSLYLWHWPVLVLGKHYFGQSELTNPQGLALLLISITLSVVSYHAIEQRFRSPHENAATKSGRSFVLMVLASVALVMVGATSITYTNGLLLRTGPTGLMALDRKAMWKWQPTDPVTTDFPKQSGFGYPWAQADHRVIVWGDSHAAHMAPLLEELLNHTTAKTSVMVYSYCPPTVDGEAFPAHNRDTKYNLLCASTRASMLDYLRTRGDDVDLVVLAAAWATRWQSHQVDEGETAGIAVQQAALSKTLQDLKLLKQRVAIVGQMPLWPKDPLPCVASAKAQVLRSSCEVSFASTALTGVFHEVHRGIEKLASPGVSVTLPHLELCKSGHCVFELNGEFIYRDRDHIRRNLRAATRHQLAKKIQLPSILESIEAS